MALVNSDTLKELSELIETLTHTGQKTLDVVMLKRVKAICRLSDEYIDHAYHLITYQLGKYHAEIRFSAFQICDEVFLRSHHFRQLVTNDMQRIMKMTAETSHKYPLPPPRSVALDLKRYALRTIQKWNTEFGEGYKKLQIAFNFLKHCKKVDFNTLTNESLAEQAQIQERERRQNAVNQEKMRKVTTEMDEMIPEMTSTIKAMQNCISLLIPMPDEFFIPDSNEMGVDIKSEKNDSNSVQSVSTVSKDTNLEGNKMSCIPSDAQNSDLDSDSEEINLREFGILNSRHSVQLNINLDIKVKRTTENAPIFENARDLYIILNNRYLPCLKKWIQVVTKVSDSSTPEKLKKLMDLKKLMENAMNKCNNLNLLEAVDDGSSTSDSDFEEVSEKEGYEPNVKEDLPVLTLVPADSTKTSKQTTTAKSQSWSIWTQENDKDDPTTPQSTLTSLAALKTSVPVCTNVEAERKSPHSNGTEKRIGDKVETDKKEIKSVIYDEAVPGPSTADDMDNQRKTKLLSVAPKLPFDVDLYHWEDEKVPVPTLMAVRAEGSQIWSARPSEGLDEIVVPDEMACSLRTRVIEFSGKFEPVKWACRAPLSNGKLCPRRDRVKCPFHGPIVPRDEQGQCYDPQDAARLQQAVEEEQAITPDWQDPQLLEEIKAATGVDLKMPEKGKRKKKKKEKKYPGLTDLKAKQNTAHNRLAKKVFKKSAMKRVARSLDIHDHKKFRDKYGDQFHYMYTS